MEKPTHGFRTITEQHARQSETHSSRYSWHALLEQAPGRASQKCGVCAGMEGHERDRDEEDLSSSPEATMDLLCGLAEVAYPL